MPYQDLPPEELDSRTPDEESSKIPQSEVAYGSPPSSAPNRTCARCRNFDGAQACALVRGPIAPDRWCTEWEEGNKNTLVRRPSPEGQYESRVDETTLAASIGSAPESRLGDKPAHPAWKWRPRRRRNPRA